MEQKKIRIGRPPKFESPEAFSEAAERYLTETPEEEWTITGLALSLGTTRETLCDYEKKDGYSDTVKRAKQFVQHAYEKSLRKNGRAGDIFGLKNFGWKDKQEHDVNNKYSGLSDEELVKRFDEKFNRLKKLGILNAGD